MKKKKKIAWRGSLASALTSRPGTLGAVDSFITSAEDAWIFFNMPEFNWSTGSRADVTDFLLCKEQWLADSDGNLERAAGAKNFSVVARYHDGGVVVVDFSQRSWEILNRSVEAESAISDLDVAIRSSVVSRFLSGGWAAVLLGGYISFGVVLGLLNMAWSIAFDQEAREIFFSSDPGSADQDFSYLIAMPEDLMRGILFFASPFLMAAGIIIFLLRLMSGALRILPQRMSKEYLQDVGFKIKKDLLPSSVNSFWLALVTGVAGVIIGKIFS